MGLSPEAMGLKRHIVNTKPLLTKIGAAATA